MLKLAQSASFSSLHSEELVGNNVSLVKIESQVDDERVIVTLVESGGNGVKTNQRKTVSTFNI